MRSLHVLLAAIVAAAGSPPAQEAILPARTYYTSNSRSMSPWRGVSFRAQTVYDTSNFTAQGITGPITIHRLRLRAADGWVTAGGLSYATSNVQLSSCPVDYLAMSPFFANNRGSDNQVCFTGPVTLAAAAGTSPNNYVVDLTLTTPFVYDPSLGRDLVIEVDAPDPSPAPNVFFFAVSLEQPIALARALYEDYQTSTIGSFSSFAGEILIDFTGPGGYATWTSVANTLQGVGCYRVARSLYEAFPGTAPLSSNDLSGRTITLVQNARGGYTAATTNGAVVVPPTGAGLALTDDAESAALPLGFTFDYPGGSTSSIVAGANGYIGLNGATTGSLVLGGIPIPSELLARQTTASAGRHVLAPSLQDLEPDGATNTNNVFANVDPGNPNVFLITWQNVSCWHAATPPGPGRSTFQVALIDSGASDAVEFRYQTLINDSDNGFFAPGEAVTGFSLGAGSMDPGSIDFTAGAAASGGPEQLPLAISASTPFIGTTVTHTLSNIPAAAIASVRLLGFGPVPGIDLGFFGAPGCQQWVDSTSAFTSLVFGSPTGTAALAVPNSSIYLGTVLYAQGASLVPGVNALGLLTSNGNTLRLGNTN
jgi:hypothetical protein